MINRFRIPLVILSLAAAAGSSAAEPAPGAETGAAASSNVASTPAHRSYVSVKGDSFTSVSAKFGCTIHELKKLNGIKSTHLKPGTTLLIPGSKAVASKGSKKKAGKTSLAEGAVKKSHHGSPLAQPVQDFDIAPSVYASCPPPPSTSNEMSDDTVPAEAPMAPLTEPAEQMPQSLVVDHRASLLPVPNLPPAPPPTSWKTAPKSPSSTTAAASIAPADNPLLPPTAPKKSFTSALADFFGGGSHGMSASESGEWGNRFLVETRNLAAQGICYDGSWRPDGESHRWEMDCSNTTRYLYQVTAGIALPRTASDQYYYLHLQDKAWDVPMTSNGFADTSFLRGNLKPGDLLFWENTYRPERQPPITHVMIYLGADARGRWLMAGSQGSKGFYNRRHSGPDVYVFDPTRAVGGYTTWLGLVHHHGRFVAYGRPLEADVKKLSVASDD